MSRTVASAQTSSHQKELSEGYVAVEGSSKMKIKEEKLMEAKSKKALQAKGKKRGPSVAVHADSMPKIISLKKKPVPLDKNHNVLGQVLDLQQKTHGKAVEGTSGKGQTVVSTGQKPPKLVQSKLSLKKKVRESNTTGKAVSTGSGSQQASSTTLTYSAKKVVESKTTVRAETEHTREESKETKSARDPTKPQYFKKTTYDRFLLYDFDVKVIPGMAYNPILEVSRII